MDLPHFLGHLERSRLLAPIDLAACRQWARQDAALSPEKVADHLLQSGRLSRYQARKLLSGRSSGFLLGPFEILAPLGKGGMAYVYLARDHEQARLVALKLLTPRQKAAHPALLPRLERELKFGRRFSHPGIIKAYALAEYHQVHVLALEHVAGVDLFRQVRRHGPLPPGLAARVMGQAALALAEIHHRGVVHTDLKPGNILVGPSPDPPAPSPEQQIHRRPDSAPRTLVPKIIDFGLALDLAEPEDKATGPGRIAGTFGYAAPEQTKAGHEIGPSADIFALGSTLFYLLTGEVPFTGETTKEKIRRIRHEEPAWYLIPAGTPPALRKLMQELLEKKAKRRPSGAAIVADALMSLARQHG